MPDPISANPKPDGAVVTPPANRRRLISFFLKNGRLILAIGLFNVFLGILGGFVLTDYLVRMAQEAESSRLIARVNTAASSLDPATIARLMTAGEELFAHPDYPAVLASLRRIHRANPDIRFAYLVKREGDKILFTLDTEPDDSSEHGQPNEPYDDAPPLLHTIFQHGQAQIIGPYDDRWGRWITGLAPIHDPATGGVVSVLCLDVNAAFWSREIGRGFWSGISISAMFLLLILFFFIGLYYQRLATAKIQNLNEQLKLSAAVMENTAEGIVVTNAAGIIESVNPAFERITGYSTAETKGQTASLLKSDRHDDSFYREMWSLLREKGFWKGVFWNKRKNGEIYPQESSLNAIKNRSGKISHFAGIFSDITQRLALEEELKRLAAKDPLTGANNRRSFLHLSQAEWERAKRNGRPFSFAMLDIDHFKSINDTHGHATGDAVLASLVQAAEKHLRPSDIWGRLGGEEFGLVLPELSAEKARAATERLRRVLAEIAVETEKGPISFTVSVGLFTVIGGDKSLEEIMNEADARLYRAKESGRDRLVAE